MRMWTTTLLLLWISGTAAAQQASREDLDNLEHALKHVKPVPGLETAPTGVPRWCGHAKPTDDAAYNMTSQLTAIHSNTYGPETDNFLIRVAAATCNAPNEPVYQHVATEIAQIWINVSGMTVTEAVASLAARIDDTTWAAEHDKLCQLPEIAPPSGNDRSSDAKRRAEMASARYDLFNCANTGGTLMNWRQHPPTQSSATADHDEIVHLAVVLGNLGYILDPSADAKEARVLEYAVVQFDLKSLDFAAAMKQLDAPPYRGNRFAKIAVIETIAKVKRGIVEVEAEVAKRASDENWKNLLITIPRGAAAAWTAAATKDAPLVGYIESLRPAFHNPCATAGALGPTRSHVAQKELCRRAGLSSADEATMHKTAAGCEAKLRDAIAPILKRQRHGSPAELEWSLSREPLGGMILEALAGCVALEGDPLVAKSIGSFARRVPSINSASAAASLATHDAVAAMEGELPFDSKNFQHLMGRAPDMSSHPTIGAIKTVSRGSAKSVKLTFETKTEILPLEICGEPKFRGWNPDHTHASYWPDCKQTGEKITEHYTPKPVTVVTGCTAGLAPGRYVELDDSKDGQASVSYVYSDNSKKRKLIANACLALE